MGNQYWYVPRDFGSAFPMRHRHRRYYVISDSSFELTSEALVLGKRILTKPIIGQMEQQSNAQALQNLGLASVCPQLDTNSIAQWLTAKERPARIRYPNVPSAICAWLLNQQRPSAQTLANTLWAEVVIP